MFCRVSRLFSSTIPALIVTASMSGYGIENRYNVFIPYVPTPDFVVDRMLEMAEITKEDLVLDMGSGDGRIVIAAAQRYGSRGRGVEIDPKLVAESKVNARSAGVSDRTDFIAQDMFVTPIADATVMTLYVLTASNLELRPRILKEMKPGSRIVSHQFSMGSWLADKHESYGDIQIYMWYVPASVAGTWIVKDGGKAITLLIEQQYQEIKGTAKIGRNTVPLRQTKLKGGEIDFAVDLDDEKPLLFRGRVSGGTIVPRGAPGDTERNWQARRTTPAMPLVK
jgi:ubiquinone/menaquinone biosynthesis C-methylase UbiE